MFAFDIPDIDFTTALPLLVVALTGLAALIAQMAARRQDNDRLVAVSLIGLMVAGALLILEVATPPGLSAASMFMRDAVGTSIQLVIVGSTALTVLFSERYMRQKGIAFGEFYPLVLWSSVGAMLMVATTNLLMVFLGLEILSIALYVMAGLSRAEEKSEESALKYFLLGAFASGFLLYGIAMIYGATGGLDLSGIELAWLKNAGETRTLLSCGLGLILIGLSFKAGFVPFHQWTPDVYQGAPTNVTAFMATVSKAGALGALWRVLSYSGSLSPLFVVVLGVIAALTMLVGNVLALAQNDVKRVLAYSSIAHAGYVLVAIVAHGRRPEIIGDATLVYYLLTYSLMTIGAFAIVSMFAKNGKEATSYKDLNGLWTRSRWASACLVVFMLSLIGLPVFAGFFGKLFVLMDAVHSGLTWLAIVLAISSIVSAGYYLRIALSALVSDEEVDTRTTPFRGGIAATATLCALGVLATSFFYTPIMQGLGLVSPVQRVAQR